MALEPNKSQILVVDDNENVRDLLRLRLETRGYNVATAINGVDALEKMRQLKIHLVLLDIMMPEMNGYQVLERIKGDSDLSNVPIVVLSALNDMDSIVRCVDLGAEDYLFKPINSSLLWSRINASLEKKHLRDQEQALLNENIILQQLDREVSASLDMKKVAYTALGWATREMGAVAGILGIVEQGVVEILATESVSTEVLLQPLVELISFENDRPYQQTPLPETKSHTKAKNQIVVPISRRDKAHIFLILETIEPVTSSQLRFLAKLADHAAIALINAQLHETVQAANRAKSDFVSLVSHELKTPMTSIDGYAALMESGVTGNLSEQQEKFLNIIRANVSRMKTIVSDLLDISQIDIGQLRIKPEGVALADIVSEVLRTMERQIVDKQQTIEVTLPADLPDLYADRARLVQILNNLLSNAHKYTPEAGHIQIKAHLQSMQDLVCIEVRDNGIGIHESEQNHIFGQFFRSGDEKARSSPGTGLGLNITKRLVELHHGEIWFESVFREGTTFYFTMPIITAELK